MPCTRAELADEAHRAGYKVSQRLITDWTRLGLLDKPARVGRGKGGGGGALYLYSDHQRDLLLALLRRRPERRDVTRLANLPVAIWLYRGDEFVPLTQARRALSTWVHGADEQSRERRARKVARHALDGFGERRKDSRTKHLEGALVSALLSENFALDPVKKSLARFVDVEREGITNDRLFGMIEYLEWLLIGMAEHDQLHDDAFLEARKSLRRSARRFLGPKAPLGGDPFGNWIDDANHSSLITESCRALTAQLGEGIFERVMYEALGWRLDSVPDESSLT